MARALSKNCNSCNGNLQASKELEGCLGMKTYDLDSCVNRAATVTVLRARAWKRGTEGTASCPSGLWPDMSWSFQALVLKILHAADIHLICLGVALHTNCHWMGPILRCHWPCQCLLRLLLMAVLSRFDSDSDHVGTGCGQVTGFKHFKIEFTLWSREKVLALGFRSVDLKRV